MKHATINGVQYFESLNGQPWLSRDLSNEDLAALFAKRTGVLGFPNGPWITKSDAQLSLLYACPIDNLPRNEDGMIKQPKEILSAASFPDLLDYFTQYDQGALDELADGIDIRGLRVYGIRNLQLGKIGGHEYHKVRCEVIFALEGEVRVDLEDKVGNTQNYTIDPYHALLIPANVMHSYTVMKPDTSIFVLANTLYDPDNSTTHDTYSRKDWEAFKEKSR